MKFICIQHVPFEPPGNLTRWAARRGDTLSVLQIFSDRHIPSLNEFDGLFILGGPMSVNDEDRLPWLRDEKSLVRAAIQTDKPVLGICLGGQMIADVLGGGVKPMGYREIGFFPVLRSKDSDKYMHALPESFIAFHWHGERFSIPAGATHLAGSQACDNQAFAYGSALALQFHLEMAPDYLPTMVKHCPEEIAEGGTYVQSAGEMQRHSKDLGDQPYHLLVKLLDNWLQAGR